MTDQDGNSTDCDGRDDQTTDGPETGPSRSKAEMDAETESKTGLPEGIPDPDAPPDFEDEPHVLAEDELVYPTFEFDEGVLSPEEGFDLRQEHDREGMQSWLDWLSGALVSHDLAVEGENLRATFGVAPDDVRMAFEPDESHRGTLSVTFSLHAKVMRYEDADERPVGSRGGRGFIPIEMLTGDRDPADFRCYNWVGDPTDGLGCNNPTDRPE